MHGLREVLDVLVEAAAQFMQLLYGVTLDKSKTRLGARTRRKTIPCQYKK